MQHIACVPKAKTDAHDTEEEDYFDESDEGGFGFELSAPRIVVVGDFFEGGEHEPDDDGSEVGNKGINARVLDRILVD